MFSRRDFLRILGVSGLTVPTVVHGVTNFDTPHNKVTTKWNMKIYPPFPKPDILNFPPRGERWTNEDTANWELLTSNLWFTLPDGDKKGVIRYAGKSLFRGVHLYSICKELWKTNPIYIRYHFPIVAISPNNFCLDDYWTLDDSLSSKLISTTFQEDLSKKMLFTTIACGLGETGRANLVDLDGNLTEQTERFFTFYHDRHKDIQIERWDWEANDIKFKSFVEYLFGDKPINPREIKYTIVIPV